MSVTIPEAKEKLNILEKIPENPQLILTKLFEGNLDNYTFLNQIKINEKRFSEYIPGYLWLLDIFAGSLMEIRGYELYIYAPSLKYGEYQNIQSEDCIMEINLHKKTYKIYDQPIDNYISILERKYTLETCYLSDFWKKFENFSFKNRVKNAFLSLASDKKLHIRIQDFLFFLVVSRKKIDAAVNKEKEKIREKNKRNLEYYKERLELQSFYEDNAPGQINRIRAKQGEIAEYLDEIGYVREYD